MSTPYDPKIVAPTQDAPHGLTVTGHKIGGIYKSSYWGHTYKVLGPAREEHTLPNGVKVQMLKDSPNMVNAVHKAGDIWTHSTAVGQDRLLSLESPEARPAISNDELETRPTQQTPDGPADLTH